MRKKILEEYVTKAKKRELKKRPRMSLHGVALKGPAPHAGKKLASR